MDVSELPDPLLAAKLRVDERGCWIWTGALDRHGYGRLRRWKGGVGKTHFAHRYTFGLVNPGRQIEGLDLDHLCRVPACCNPAHLEPVPHGVNIRRGVAGEATRTRYADHLWCPQGHPLFGENLYLHYTTGSSGHRYWNKQCRTCRAANDKKRKAARRAARAERAASTERQAT